MTENELDKTTEPNAGEQNADPRVLYSDAAPAEDDAKAQYSGKAQDGAKAQDGGKSGAYYYVPTDNDEIIKNAFNVPLLGIIAMLLEVVVLMLPQGGLEYVTLNIPSYAYAYMWIVLVMLAFSVYVIIMSYTRARLQKRIPARYAPRRGFARRTFMCYELNMGVHGLLFIVELSFVCIRFDVVGLIAMFICAVATGAAVWARMIAYLTLRDAELIPDKQDG